MSDAFFDWFRDVYPTLHDDPDCVRLWYSVQIASAAGKACVIPYAQINGLGLGRNSEHYVGKVADACGVPYTEHDHLAHLARTVQVDQATARRNLLRIQRSRVDGKVQYMPATGEKITRTLERKKRRHARAMAAQIEEAHRDSPVIDLVRHLNREKLPAGFRAPFEARLDQLLRNGAELEAESETLKSAVLRHEELLKAECAARFGYLYEPGRRDLRLYLPGTSLQGICTEDRRAVMPFEDGFLEVDLVSAHPSIAAMLIGAAALDAMIAQGVWPVLEDWTGALKARLKLFLTSLVYASGIERQLVQLMPAATRKEREIRVCLTGCLDRAETEWAWEGDQYCVVEDKREILQWVRDQIPDDVVALRERLVQHTAIRDLRKGVRRLLQKIKRDGYMVDFHGRKVAAPKTRTVLFAVVTSYEKELIRPIFRLKETGVHGYSIPLDQHDGLTLYVMNPGRRDEILRRATNAVKTRAAQLGINTRLVVKNAPEDSGP